jgi:hypothetical protein
MKATRLDVPRPVSSPAAAAGGVQVTRAAMSTTNAIALSSTKSRNSFSRRTGSSFASTCRRKAALS